MTPAAPTRTNSSQKGKAAGKEASLRVAPPSVATKWGTPDLSSDDARLVGGDRVAWVAPTTLEKIRGRLGEGQEGSPLQVSLRLKKENKKEETPEAGDSAAEKPEDEEEPPLEAWLVGWEEMPLGTMVLSGELESDWSTWGQAKVALSSTRPSGKANGSRSLQHLETSSASGCTLAGVDGVINKALSYFRRAALTDHARPLLLNGSKGSGKTSIAKAVGAALEADRSILSRKLVSSFQADLQN